MLTKSTEATPLVAPVVATPVGKPIEPAAPGGPRADGLRDASDMAGCWGCCCPCCGCIPCCCTLGCQQADGPDALVHKGICFFLPCPCGKLYEDRYVRVPKSNVFQKEGADDKVDYSGSANCLLLSLIHI